MFVVHITSELMNEIVHLQKHNKYSECWNLLEMLSRCANMNVLYFRRKNDIVQLTTEGFEVILQKDVLFMRDRNVSLHQGVLNKIKWQEGLQLLRISNSIYMKNKKHWADIVVCI